MAKKKTENIKAAPVLRAQDNEQLTPTPEQTGTRTYQIMDPWKDRDVVNLVDVKAVDGEITEVKVNGVPAGGGGGASLISVEIINNRINNIVNGDYNISCVLSDQSSVWDFPEGTLIYPKENWEGPDIAARNNYTIQNIVIAGNGNASIFFSNPTYTYNVTGSITRVNNFEQGALFIVTGPGTITIS